MTQFNPCMLPCQTRPLLLTGDSKQSPHTRIENALVIKLVLNIIISMNSQCKHLVLCFFYMITFSAKKSLNSKIKFSFLPYSTFGPKLKKVLFITSYYSTSAQIETRSTDVRFGEGCLIFDLISLFYLSEGQTQILLKQSFWMWGISTNSLYMKHSDSFITTIATVEYESHGEHQFYWLLFFAYRLYVF